MKQNFDYAQEIEQELIRDIEESQKYDTIFNDNLLEDKLRSQKIAKLYKKWIEIYQPNI